MLLVQVDDYPFDVVTVDNRTGALKAVRHLIDLGHRRIATITGKMMLTTAIQRLEGYKDALRDAGLPIDKELIRDGRYEADVSYQAARELLDLRERPTALFVANEPMTLGALRALKERGVRVPEDMAIISFDETPWSPYVDPPLTTVSQPTYALGREAVRLLIRRLNEPEAPYLTVTLTTELILRESTGKSVGKNNVAPSN